MKKLVILLFIVWTFSCQNSSQLVNDQLILWSWSLPSELRCYPIDESGKAVPNYSYLHKLAFYENDQSKLLKAIQNGADPNMKAWAGNTPLHFAATAGKTKNCAILIKAGADLDCKNNMGLTPLDYAQKLENKHVESLLNKYKMRRNL